MKIKGLIAALCLAASQAANAGVINFDDLSLVDFGDIPTNYADHGLGGNGDARVGVSYSGSNGLTNHLDFWNSDYGDLSKVAFTPTDGTNAKIILSADPGWLIKSVAFDMAGWPTTDLVADTLLLTMEDFIANFSGATIQGAGATHSSFSATVFAGRHVASIEWGTDWNIGIDNIVFELIADPDAGKVPEPATLPLIGAAIAAMTLLRRRNSA